MLRLTFLLYLTLCMSIQQITGFLMYPPDATSLSLIASISVPVSEFFPERRLLIDWCFTMNYNLPSKPSQFYNIPIWPVKQGTKSRRDLYELFAPYNGTEQQLYEKYEHDTLKDKRHPTDFTAGELYQGIEDFLVTYGFHETCLLRTVCELAQHPFDDQHQNVITDIVTFFLTPSMHDGFDDSEAIYRKVYGDAEINGLYDKDCALLYPHCPKDLLLIITNIIFPYN